MATQLFLVSVACLAFVGAGCTSQPATQYRADGYVEVSTPATYYLTPDQRSQLRHASNHGDAKASYALALYYLFVENKDSEGLDWMRASARQGNAAAVDFLRSW
jgi:TPR repeat protein